MASLKFYGLVIIGCFWIAVAQAQEETTTQSENSYNERAEGLVSFLGYMLNTLGDANTSTRDKDVIITQSYAKIFRDADVQIEDDLLENRQVITNKDVTAYLKDVEFFFEDVSFEYNIIDITEEVGEDDQAFLKVQLDRQLTGLTVEGDSVNNSQSRYIEINIDKAADELKIVSIYTTKVSRDEELLVWWNALSYEWTSILLSKLEVVDSVSTTQLYQIIDMDSLDLSNNPFVVDLSPLQMLTKLQYLNIDNVRTEDFSSLRYLNKLKRVSAAGCELTTLEHLRYARDLQVLNLSENQLTDSLDWSPFSKTQQLNISETGLLNYDFLGQLPDLKILNMQGNMDVTSIEQLPPVASLKELNLTKTNINSLDGISNFSALDRLIVAGTPLSEIGAAALLKSLSYLDIENTPIKTLSELNGTESLLNIRADNSQISQLEAAQFMAQHPDALVVVNTRENELWWRGLSPAWKTVLRAKMNLSAEVEPDLKQIIRLFNITELDLSDQPIQDIEPLERFSQLQKLDISGSGISSLSFASSLALLEELQANKTPLNNLNGLENHPSLLTLDVANTSVRQLQVLSNVPTLNYLKIDNTLIPKEVAILWQLDHSSQLVIFQSQKLTTWWSQLGPTLQQKMRGNLPSEKTATPEYLHQLVKSSTLSLAGREIMDLSAIQPFYNLRSLTLSETQITSLVGIEQFTRLAELECSKSPLYDIKSLPLMKSLKALSIRDTPIDDLQPVASLHGLESLNCSGTNIKNLKGLELLRSLETLDCSNTQIRNLSPLSELRSLQELICYNTRLNSKNVANFRDEHPRCKVSYY